MQSTNVSLQQHINEARAAGAPLPEGTSARADYQTGGRGRHGRSWEAPAGESLTVSYLLGGVGLRPDRVFVLSQAVALAARACVERLLGGASAGVTCAVKWPNDVLVGDRKVCGLLLENTLHDGAVAYSIAGVGLNVNGVDRERHPRATSLRAEAGTRFDVEEVWRALTAELQVRHHSLRASVRRGDTYDTPREYHAHLYGYGHLLRFRDLRTGDSFVATLRGVTPDGRLRLNRDGQQRLYGLDDARYLGRVAP